MEGFIQILKVFWFFLPAALANMAPFFFRKFPFLGSPVDFGKKFYGQRIFGENKTFRGFVVAIIVASLVLYFQTLVYPYFSEISLFDYSQVNVFLVGFLFGFGAMFGDLIESFVKRRLKIPSGESLAFFDQVDWVIGGLIFVSFYLPVSFYLSLGVVLLYGLLHFLSRYVGYWLGITKTKI